MKSTQRFVPYLAVLLSVVSLVFGIRTSHRIPEPQTFQRAGVTSSPSLAQLGVFDVTTFGAKCDGATNDAAAFAKAETARAAASGILLVPPKTCLTNSILTAGAAANWRGTPGVSTLKAGASMDAVASFTGASNVGGIVFSGNRLARHAVLELGDANTVYESCQFNDALVDGIRQAMSLGPAVFGTLVHVGTGPAVTFSQPDPYLYQSGTSPAIKITLGGALGTATFRPAADGVTFNPPDQVLFASTMIGSPQSVIVTTTGIQVNANAGTYALNDTYTAAGSSTQQSINDFVHYVNCSANNDGAVYTTAGFAADYAATYNPVAATGTVATVASSQVVTGSGTHFLSQFAGSIDGDMMRINGKRFMISAVASDTIIYLDNGNLPQFSGSGFDYAVAVGAAFSQDPQTGHQEGVQLSHCTASNSATGMRYTGLGGPFLDNPVIRLCAISGITIGTTFAD